MPGAVSTVVGGSQRGTFRAFGVNPDVDSGTVPEDLWSGPQPYPFPLAALTTTIQSDDAADAATGTGAQACRVFGLNEDLLAVHEDVVMAGTTPVTLATRFLRINRVRVRFAGSTLANVGTITVTHPGPVIIANMRPGFARTLAAIFTIPVDAMDIRLDSIFASIGRSGGASVDVEIALQQRFPIDGGAFQTREVIYANTNGSSTPQLLFPSGLPVDPGTDFRMRATDITANNVTVAGGFVLSTSGAGQEA